MHIPLFELIQERPGTLHRRFLHRRFLHRRSLHPTPFSATPFSAILRHPSLLRVWPFLRECYDRRILALLPSIHTSNDVLPRVLIMPPLFIFPFTYSFHGSRAVRDRRRASPIPPANSTNPDDRASSPPPDYEPFPSPRPTALRIESSPELRRIDPPGSPSTAGSQLQFFSRLRLQDGLNDRRPQPYDLDRIDELDETSPLGVSLHHEGPFQAISAALKGPSPLGNQSIPQKMRPSRAHKSDNVAGGSGFSIVPGQVVPRIFQQYYQPGSYMQNYQQDSSHPSTSYLPPQPPYGPGSTMVPPVAQGRPNHDPRRPS
ncbi:hypothetical protein C8J57DRAFT_1490810 [Mycena rebaudengoi]|nr:hypothetical protein C8J57DRAFT_1490810 [Mycena rebaudengoi]